MKITIILLYLTIIIASCNNSSLSTNMPSGADTLSSMDSNFSGSISKKVADTTSLPAIHLKDTIFIKGNYVLFLRPDDATFKSYEAEGNEGIYEVDSDFGFAISATLDTMSVNKKYKYIKTDVTERRYIVIKDCKNGPVLIDRDTINFGLILSGKGKAVQMSTFVHSGDYLTEVDEYFKIKIRR